MVWVHIVVYGMVTVTAKESLVTGCGTFVSFYRKRMDSWQEKQDSGRNSSRCSSRSANICFPGRRGRRRRIGTRIATRTFCHVSCYAPHKDHLNRPYSHAPHNDSSVKMDNSVNDGLHIRWWSHKIIKLYCYNVIILTIVLQLPAVFSTVKCCTGL